jgi:Zn-dependent M28 family amino/carboxypeptidase
MSQSLAQKLIKNPPKHNVILLFTDGKEISLTGAKAFAKDHEAIMANIKLNINLDMLAVSKQTTSLRYISRGLNNLLNESNIERLQDLQNAFDVPIKKGIKIKSFRGKRHLKWLMSSDHGVFHSAVIPFIYFGVGTHIIYHQYSDTFRHVNHGFFNLATNAIYRQLLFIDHNI